ncbi:unnamed protein product [Diabrotica balteata]|uniref:CCHC-type domain-containing protein n=1 Tax=Diabrotica balteata TaxID=107213 RepID=A0A9N9T0G0_DIABA|nr:unnamed protein product [Diabrotica balteata]
MLANCFQRHEAYRDFTTRLRILAARVLEEDLEGATIEVQPGIKKKNKELVLNQFTGAYRTLALQEMNLLMIQGRANAARVSAIRKEQRCHYCNRTGHPIRECRTKKREQSSPAAQEVKCYKCEKRKREQNASNTTPTIRKTKARFIVCSDITLGEVLMLLGRDFLANHKAIISYKDEPSLILWGQSIPMITAGEIMEVMTVKPYDNSHKTTRQEWNKWLSIVKEFLDKQHINDIKEDRKNLPNANRQDTSRKNKTTKQSETQKKSQSLRVSPKQHTTYTKTSNSRNKTKRTEKTRIFTPTKKRTKQGRTRDIKQDTDDRRKRLDTVENPLNKGEVTQRNQEEIVHHINEDTQQENDQSKEEEKEPKQGKRSKKDTSEKIAKPKKTN